MASFHDGLLETASFRPSSLQVPDAWCGHLQFAAWLIRVIEPGVFVELGTHTGNSFFSFCQSVSEENLDTKCYAVDTWEGDEHAGNYDEEVFHQVSAYNQANYASFSRLLRMKFDDAVSYFADSSIELLHIDGLHTYEAVRHDFETWLPKLASGAIVLFHDTTVRERGFGVWRLWEELQARYPNNIEFFHSHGLGVLQIDGATGARKLAWLDSNAVDQHQLRGYFSALGAWQLERFELGQVKIHVAKLSKAVASRDEKIDGLNKAVVERDEKIDGLNKAVVERDRRVADFLELESALRGNLTGVTEELEKNHVHLREQQLELENLARLRTEHLQALENLGNELQVVYRSRSWRLTRPLRGVLRIPHAAYGFVPRSARFVANLLKAIRIEVHRHGVTGFSRRLPFYFSRYRDLAALIASRPPSGDGLLFDKGARPKSNDIRLHPELVRGSIESIENSVSVVIPTLNAGTEFRWLLRKLRAQQGIDTLEIVIVDSGSTDDTLKLARESGCTLVQIAPQDFSHSHARNIGADAASGDYLLFMVQDAYPIGSYWVYGILRYLLDHASQQLVGASCSEYSRTDSDMMYDSIINTHYKFLGCLEYDRIGEYQGDDHMSLRTCGQLSDVACMMTRELFARYRYRGDYAEDLDLGIRLIKDGYRVAMLASVKVIHSHNRSSYYYLKRSLVDVIFLVGIFKDFTYPTITSVRGLLVGIVSVAIHLSEYFSAFEEGPTETVLHDDLDATIKVWRKSFEPLRVDGMIASGDAQLDAYVRSLAERFLDDSQSVTTKDHQEARRFLDAFLARLEHFNVYVAGIYLQQDTLLRRGLRDVIRKTFAATAGSALGFMCLDYADDDSTAGVIAGQIKNELKAGI